MDLLLEKLLEKYRTIDMTHHDAAMTMYLYTLELLKPKKLIFEEDTNERWSKDMRQSIQESWTAIVGGVEIIYQIFVLRFSSKYSVFLAGEGWSDVDFDTYEKAEEACNKHFSEFIFRNLGECTNGLQLFGNTEQENLSEKLTDSHITLSSGKTISINTEDQQKIEKCNQCCFQNFFTEYPPCSICVNFSNFEPLDDIVVKTKIPTEQK